MSFKARHESILIIIAVAMLVSVVLPLTASAEVVDRIVAVINDSIITQSDISDFQKKLKSNGLLDKSLLELYDEKKLLNDQKYLLEYMVDEKTIDSEVKHQGLVSPVEQVENEIGNIAKGRHVTQDQLKTALKNEGIVYSDYQDFIKTSLQRQTLLQKEVSSKIKISDEEVSAYYMSQHPNSDALVFEYTLAHIEFNGKGREAEALKRANEVKEKLNQGIPFESLAAQYSEDPQFVQGGAFGTFRLNDFNKDVRDVMRPLGVGDVSTIVKMSDDYQIFKVLKKSLVPSPDLDEKREEIRRKLMGDNFKRQYRSWIEEKRRESFIRINS